MKKNVWLAVLMAAALAGAWQVVRAQDDPAPKGDGDKPALCHGMNNGGEMGMGPMGRLREKLGLTDEQATQIKDLFKKQMESNQPLRDQMKIDMDTLQQKVDMKASDGDLKKLLDKLDGEQKQMQASREKMKDQLRAILTPAQQAKFVYAGEDGEGRAWLGEARKEEKRRQST